jgi:hypothetical protein
MKNVHLLPTEKPSRLYLHSNNELQLRTNIIRTSEDYLGTNQHIYITSSDEEIKEGDYVVVDCSEIEIEEVRLVIGYYNEQFLFDDRGQIHMDYCKKIILTTDPQLIADGVQPIDNEFLEWFVKNSSCEFVEVDKNWNYPLDKRWEYKIIIPQEEPNYNMKNVHLLPTDKPSRLYQKENRFQLSTHPAIDWYISSASYKPVNIYITSDEVIKDWFIYKTENKAVILKAKNINSDTITVDSHIEVGTWVSLKYCKKIILTTDQDLIKDGIQPIEDYFLEWFVKNPSCEFVETQCSGRNCIEDFGCTKEGCNGVEPLEIIIPQEELKQEYVKCTCANSLEYSNCGKKCERILDEQEPKQETIEETYLNQLIDEANKEFTLDRKLAKDVAVKYANWQAERMYSEEEVISIVEKSRETGLTAEYLLLTDQYKKK